MFHLLILMLLLSMISIDCSAAIHSIHPRQRQARSTLDPSSTSTSNLSSTGTSMRTHNSSHITSLASVSSHHTDSLNSSNTILPTPLYFSFDEDIPFAKKNLKNYEDIESGFCDLADNFCSFKDANGTIREASPLNMSDQCVLWDTSCSGDKTLAMERFFSIAFPDGDDPENDLSIMDKNCFAQNARIQSDCVTYNPPDRLLEWQKMKDWMRSPQCVSAAEEWQNMTGHPWGFIFDDGVNESYSDWHSYWKSSRPAPSCCPWCDVQAQNVDIYYWPEPNADLSCLSIIGGSVRPLDYGATIATVFTLGSDILRTTYAETYWACNYTDPMFPGSTFTDLSTAIVSTIGGLAVKIPLVNPWSPSPCFEDNTGSQSLNKSIKYRDAHAPIRARDHSLLIPSSITQTGGLSMSTVVSGGFTL